MKSLEDIESLVSDPGFRNWVLSPDEFNNRYWDSIARGNRDKIEIIKKARLVVLGLNQPETDFNAEDELVLLDRIQTSIKEKEESTNKIHRISHHNPDNRSSSGGKWWYLVAASAGLIVATWFGVQQASVDQTPVFESVAMIEKEVPKGQKLKMYLPDGSKVALNAGSKISYPEKFEGNIRNVRIEGEAFFEVKKDSLRPFVVESNNLLTEVLGTSFNVKSYPEANTSSVSLIEGSVKVKPVNDGLEEKEFITISPGEQVNFDKAANKLSKGKITNQNELLWMDGVLSFTDEKIEKVFNKLELWYGVDFVVKGIPRDKVLTGKFTNEYLDNVLNSINYTVKFDYEIDGDTVYVEFKN